MIITNPFSNNLEKKGSNNPKNNINPNNIIENNLNNSIIKKEKHLYQKYNCSSYYINPITNIFPRNKKINNQLPFFLGINFSPLNLNGNEIPLINYYQENNFPRCKNPFCHAYISPFTKLIQNGEKYICHICNFINQTDTFFSQKLENNYNNNIELCNSSYEFITSKAYWGKKNPNKSFFIFVIDTSLHSINSNFLFSVIESLKDAINNNIIFNYSFTKVSFITYNNNIQFYSFNQKSNQTQPQILNITDEEPFLPIILDNLIFDLEKEKEKILQIIDCISTQYLNNNNLNNIIRDSNKIFDSIKSAYLIGEKLGGNIFLFSSSNNINKLPKMNGQTNNDINNKELFYYSPNDKNQLRQIGLLLTKSNLSIDLFVNCDKVINLITLNQLCEYSNGTIHLFKNYNYDEDYFRLFNQIRKCLSRFNVYEGEMRIRFSHRYKIQNFFTPTLISNINNNTAKVFVCPSINNEQSYQITIDFNDNINDNNNNNNNNDINDELNDYDNYLFIQSALLYSYGDGTKRVRIHNLSIPLSENINDIFNGINSESLICMFMKMGIDKTFKIKSLSNSYSFMQTTFNYFITSFYKLCYQKELTQNLENLPIYFLGLLKNKIYNIKEIENKYDIDISNYYRIRIQKIPNEEILPFIVPNIYPLHKLLYEQNLGLINKDTGIINLPEIIPPKFSSLENNGFYLIDNGFYLILYFRKLTDTQIIKSFFQVENLDNIQINYNENLFFENVDDLKEKILNILDYIRSYKSIYQKLIFIIEGTEEEKLIKECLIYDNYCNWYPIDFKNFYIKYFQYQNNINYYQ